MKHEMIMSDDPVETPQVFLVLERNPLIAEDIVGSLYSVGATRVIHVRTPEEIAASLGDVPRVCAAFLEMRYDRVLESGVHRDLLDRGARLILTIGEDDKARVQARGWAILLRPFSDRMIRDTLTGTRQGA